MIKTITGHVGSNLWLWTGIGFAVAIAAAFARNSIGKGYYLGEIITVAAMFAGTTMILISQRGMPAPVATDDDDDA